MVQNLLGREGRFWGNWLKMNRASLNTEVDSFLSTAMNIEGNLSDIKISQKKEDFEDYLSVKNVIFVDFECSMSSTEIRDNIKNKLTHAGWFGTDCMIKSIENIFDIDINYYVKVNFKHNLSE